MAIYDEKEAKYRIRVRSTGKAPYATLNILAESARDQISSQLSVEELDDEDKLLDLYANKLHMPTVAYLRIIGFRGEYQDNKLINGQMHDTLAKCMYVGN